jgi:hypothetical protein
MAGSSSEGRTSRTRSVGTKISDEEYARLEASAAESGLTVGEWCREVLLKASGQSARRSPRPPKKRSIRTPRTPHDPAQSLLRCGQRRPATTSTVQTLDIYGNLTRQTVYDYSSATTPLPHIQLYLPHQLQLYVALHP